MEYYEFLSTPSARRATNSIEDVLLFVFISIHALREEGDAKKQKQRKLRWISIHALREEGDNPTATYESIAYNFYPRPPRGGRPK